MAHRGDASCPEAACAGQGRPARSVALGGATTERTPVMLTKINTDGNRFRVAGTARPKQVRGEQARTRDGRPVWTVRLTAIEDGRGTAETIWVEVAGDEPVLTVDDLVHPAGLIYTPWVNRKGEIVRSFRADQITPLDSAARKAA